MQNSCLEMVHVAGLTRPLYYPELLNFPLMCKCLIVVTEHRGRATQQSDEESDGKREYAKAVVWRGLNDYVRRRALKRNDGPAMMRHWRLDMIEFHSRKHPKYLLLGNHLLTAVNGGVSDRLRHQMVWNRTVNVNGGEGNNIAMDLYNEFINGYFKGK